ncbi:MAG TPA: hypothetical protein VHA78_00525 [Candidatus Peribacteraceae bacterium]|nr:hypothetical protein [Candidatus Peribacteraceae bacterium]
MKLKTLFERSVQIGIDSDPRGRAYIEKMLKKEQDRSKKLEGREKELYDDERTWNPYADSRILWGDDDVEVKRLMVGIDIETQEFLLADRLREKGEQIDAVLIHHPEGRALADLDKVMPLQIDVYAAAGVPVNHSENLLRPRMDRIWRAIHADNLFRSERTAQLLNIPALGCHTITDNLVWKFIEDTVCKKQFDEVGEILDALFEIEEFKYYAKKGNPPIIVNGSRGSRPGKLVATEFTGGTNGPEDLIERQSQAGVGTILAMHFTEKEVEQGKAHNLNLIQCSHMASDSLGVNLLIDALNKEEPIDVLEVSGFVRVKR